MSVFPSLQPIPSRWRQRPGEGVACLVPGHGRAFAKEFAGARERSSPHVRFSPCRASCSNRAGTECVTTAKTCPSKATVEFTCAGRPTAQSPCHGIGTAATVPPVQYNHGLAQECARRAHTEGGRCLRSEQVTAPLLGPTA
eukprot:354957-Chlamydomonas_euryale.AAC.5